MKIIFVLLFINRVVNEETDSSKNDQKEGFKRPVQFGTPLSDQMDVFHKFLAEKNKKDKTVAQKQGTTSLEGIGKEDTIKTALEMNEKLELGQHYDVKKSAVLEITEEMKDKNLIIICSGYQMIRIILMKPGEASEHVLNERIILLNQLKNYYVPINKKHIAESVGGRLEIIIENLPPRFMFPNMKNNSQSYILIKQQDYIELDLNQEVYLATNFTNQVNIKVKANNTDNNEDRYTFYSSADINPSNISPDQKFQILVNYNSDFPSILEKSDISQNQLSDSWIVASVNKKFQQEFYCKEDSCYYYVTLVVNQIDFVSFFVQKQSETISTLLIQDLEYENEIKNGETLQLNLDLRNFSFQSLCIQYFPMGEESFYLLKSNGTNDVITEFVMNHINGATVQVFSKSLLQQSLLPERGLKMDFLMADQTKSGAFKVYVLPLQLSQKISITMSQQVQISLGKDEMQEFIIPINNSENQQFFWDFQALKDQGNFEIIVKICENQLNCRIFQADVDNAKNTDKNPNPKNASKNVLMYYKDTNILKSSQEFISMFLFKFKCQGTILKLSQSIFSMQPSLPNCQVIIQVKGMEEKNRLDFKIQGQSENKEMMIDQIANMALNENESVLLQIPISKQQFIDNRYFLLKAVSLIGKTEIFFSNSDQDLDKESNDGTILFDRLKEANFETDEKKISALLRDEGQSFLYIKIVAKTYSILDLFPTLSESQKLDFEKLDSDVLYHRSFSHDEVYKHDQTVTYYKNFSYAFVSENENETTQIVLTSQYINLKICVQLNQESIIRSMACDYETDSMILKIPNSVFGADQNKIAIEVSKEFNLIDEEVSKQLDFTITIRNYEKINENIPKLELFQPGKVYTHIIKPQEEIYFALDFSLMTYQGLISLTTFNHNLTAQIYKDGDENDESKVKATLNSRTFGYLFFYDDFIEELFEMMEQKRFIIKVKNGHVKNSSRFSLTYTHDSEPIQLTEGSGIYIPNNMQNFFVYKSLSSKIFDLNIKTEETKFEVFLQLNEKDVQQKIMFDRVSETNYEFKCDLESECEIAIPPKLLVGKYIPFVDFLYNPKEFFELPKEGQHVLSIEHRAIVSLNTQIKELYPFETIYDNGINGDMKYYYFLVDEIQDSVIVSLNIINGETDLYLSKGFSQLPTLNNYWKKSDRYKGDEIEISPSMFQESEEMIGVYTVGVYCREESKFSLVYAPDFGKIFHLSFQKVVNIKMNPATYYYLYFHKSKNNYNSYLYSSNSDIHVDALEFEEKTGIDFINLIGSDENYKQNFIYYKKSPPRRQFLKTDGDKNNRMVVRILASEVTEFIFAIYDKDFALEISSEKRFHFQLEKDEAQVFKMKLDQNYEKIAFDLKLQYGKLSYQLNDSNSWEGVESNNVNTVGQIFKQQFKDLDQAGDLIIFQNFFVRVTAAEETYFSFFMKPEEKFKELTPMEPELVKVLNDRDSFFYFELNQKDTNLVSFQFELKISKQADQLLPELFYLSESNITLDKNTDFLPMPIKDYIKEDSHHFLSIIVKPVLKQGFFIVKIPSNKLEQMVKLTLNINDQKSLQLNGFTQQFFNPYKFKNEIYSLYIPKPGKLRIILSNCQNLTIAEPQMFQNELIHVGFDNNFAQQIQYISSDFSRVPNIVEIRKYSENIYMLYVKDPGLLIFKVVMSSQFKINFFDLDENQLFLKKNFYDISTEFIVENQSLNLKDYIEFFDPNAQIKIQNMSYEYQEQNKNLMVTVSVPRFKEQLPIDFPEIKMIRIVLKFYLLKQDGDVLMLEFEQCGSEIFDSFHYAELETQRVIDIATIRHPVNLSVKFLEKDLHQAKSMKTLSIYVKMEVLLLKDDYDYWGINLNEKQLIQPLGIIKIINEQYSSNFMLKVFGLAIVLLFVGCLFFQWQRGRKIIENDIIYSRRNVEDDSVISVPREVQMMDRQKMEEVYELQF